MDTDLERISAEMYAVAVSDWPGEIDFYLELARQAGGSVLELACGTGRIAARLARAGIQVLGIDISAAMLDVARRKSAGLENARWLAANMRSFDLGEQFALVICPGHSFQFMLTAEDQVSCLDSVRRHLAADGRLVLHLDSPDYAWLAACAGESRGIFEFPGEFTHPLTGRRVRREQAWEFDPATQEARVTTLLEELDSSGAVERRWRIGPTPLHAIFRVEVEHLLGRCGFAIEALYGGFDRSPYAGESSEMVWIARPGR